MKTSQFLLVGFVMLQFVCSGQVKGTNSLKEALKGKFHIGAALKHSDKISRVTMWGLSDGDSWKNNFPVRGRTDYSLLFDRNHQPKEVVKSLVLQTQPK